MAATLARIIGTEQDRSNCPFYYRIGACRHGDRCSRQHLKPHFSQTLMIPHMYIPSVPLPPLATSEAQANTDVFRSMPDQVEFEDFYEDCLDEFEQYGRVEEFVVVQNFGEHLQGNVYIKYTKEEEAEKAMRGINGRYYKGRLLHPEFSPVTNFADAVCGMFKKGFCERGDFCNFMHARPLTSYLRRRLREAFDARHLRSRSRSRSHTRAAGGDDNDNGDDLSSSRFRSDSEERRARIAAWAAEKEGGNGASA